ncbi:MAG: heme exporter protein CcmB [Deltaproteobacteria bacterium]|nr:heme exporter protein CcmB [Deltaproteobacteria bacterium]MBI3388061.1 heme exporter protein CcmB [Deltaproteobacteria bacterium]
MFALLWKDLQIEFRTKETLASLLMLGLLTLLILSFAFDPMSELRGEAAPAVLWVVVIFAGVLGINRSFLTERENECLHGLLLAPVDRGTIYLAKVAGNVLFMVAAQLIVGPIFVLFFNLPLTLALLRLAAVVLLGLIGFAAVGSLFAAIAVRTRAREVMLPLLLLPLAVPVLIAGVKASDRILAGKTLGDVSQWLHLLLGFDLVFLVVGWLLFEYAVEE